MEPFYMSYKKQHFTFIEFSAIFTLKNPIN